MLQLVDLRIYDHTQLILLAATFLAVVGLTARDYLLKSEKSLPLPPSPPTWRLKGHFVPHHHPFLTTSAWIDQYGPVITIRAGTQKIVIIGRYKAAVEIMEKQGVSLADRPRLVAAGKMLGGELSIGLAPVGDRFNRKRRALHSHLQPKAADAYQPLLMSHAKDVVLSILDDPDNFQNHVTTYGATTIMKIAYGKTTPTSATDPEVREVHQLFESYRAAMHPGAYLVDTFPFLQYIPWYGRGLRREFERGKRLFTAQMNRVKQQMESNADVGPSFVKHMLENGHLYGLTETEMAFLAGAFFGGGSDSTIASLCTVLMAAACFPEEQAKVYDEINTIIGNERAPNFADRECLPQVEAFISEALRWRPALASGLAHRASEDVIWEGYLIPEGTTVFGNHWAISRDPEVYPDPHAFKPQRWIDDHGRLREDLKFVTYGFGRRVCPGQYVGDRSLFIITVLVLWAFQLTLDPTKPHDDMGYISGVMPNNTPCTIEFKARVPEAEIRRMLKNYPETTPVSSE